MRWRSGGKGILVFSALMLCLCIFTGFLLKRYEPLQQIGEALGMDMTVRNTCMLLNMISIDYETTPPYVVAAALTYAQAASGELSQCLIWLYSRLGHIFVAALTALTIELLRLLLTSKPKP